MTYGIVGFLGHSGVNLAIPRITEVTMTAPDIIRVEVIDPPITKYAPASLGVADVGSYLSYLYPRSNATEGGANWAARVISLTKKWLKFADKQATVFLDRAAARTTSNWGTIGGKTVSNIYYQAKPYDQGISNATGSLQALNTASKHYLYLHLSGNLPAGSYTISNATAGLAGVAFTFNDLTTRACSISVNQAGYRPGDISKQAYLSIWLPGHANEGAIDFLNDYVGLTAFNIIDASNSVVWSSGVVSQRTTPTTAEQSVSMVTTVSTKAPKIATALTAANPGVVTCTGHGFSNGQVKHFRGFAGVSAVEQQNLTITVVDANHFSVGVSTVGQTWVPGTYLAGYDGLILDTISRNRTQTFVFDLDFSAYTTASAGTYRLQIPGLGVSDPFLIHNGVHSRVAQNAVAGYYHQLNGLALDGRFGYTRPAPFVDGVNGVAWYWSTLPAAFGSEWQDAAPSVLSSLGGKTIASGGWLTTTRAPTGLYGSWMDAGDWDDSLWGHCLAMYYLADFCYEKLPTATRMTSFNFPKSSATLDPTLYAGSDFLPDAIHQTLWFADFYRRTQDTSGTSGLDGRLASGIGYDTGNTVSVDDGGTGGGASGPVEPSFLSINQPFLYAADESSNFAGAGLFAKIAIIFNAEATTATGLGQTQRATDMTRIASTYQTAAVSAYNWAAALYADTGTGGVRDAYYKTYLGIDTKAAWSGAQYASAMTSIKNNADANGTGGSRAFAAAALFRLTLSSTYRTIIESYFGNNGTFTDEAFWEYCFAHSYGGGDTTYNTDQAYYLTGGNSFQAAATNAYVNYQESVPLPPYRVLTHFNVDVKTTIRDGVATVLRAHIANRTVGGSDVSFLRCLQAASAYYYGANPIGISFSVGIGTRYPRVICNRDMEAMAVGPQTGITPYGPYGFQFAGGPFNFSTDNGSNFTVEFPSTSLNQVVEPYRFSTPVFEHFIENSYCIIMSEFTYEETINPRQSMAMWLHGWDNNTVT